MKKNKNIFFIKTFILASFIFLFTVLPVHARGTSGTCTCDQKGKLDTSVMNIHTVGVNYIWKDLSEPEVFPDIEADDCKNGFHSKPEDLWNAYRGCKFELTNPTVTSIADEFKISEPILGLTWPGLKFTDADQAIYTDAYGKRYLQMPWLAEFIENLYTFALGIVSIVAVIMIIIEGIQMILAGTSIAVEGFDSKTGEKQAAVSRLKNITRILIGLFIAWSSYAILYQINPDLVSFKILQVDYIEEVDMPVDLSTPSDGGELGDTFPNTWKPFPDLANVSHTQNKIARADIIQAFTTVAVEYGNKISLNSAGRTPQGQYNIIAERCSCPRNINTLPSNISTKEWYKYCDKIDLKNGRQVKSGDCGTVGTYIRRKNGILQGPLKGHLVGNAIDINGSSLSKIKCDTTNDKKILASDGVINAGGRNIGWCIPKQQQILIGVMIKNGFCVGLSSKANLREPWHFEYTKNELGTSNFCTNDPNDANLKKLKYLGL